MENLSFDDMLTQVTSLNKKKSLFSNSYFRAIMFIIIVIVAVLLGVYIK